MLRFKYKDLKLLYISFILLVLSINSCVYDPGWRYKVIDPYHENTYHYKYFYRSYPLNIELAANDFAYETDVKLKINIALDSIIIYPNFAYISSPHFIDKKHAPISIKIKYFSSDSLILSKKISKDEFLCPYCLNKGDSFLVNFTYPGFAIYSNAHDLQSAAEKSDFILHYDIFNNKNPLIFAFIPDIDTTKNQ